MKLKKDNTKNIAMAGFLVLSLFGLIASPIIVSEFSFADTCTDTDTTACVTIEVTVPLYLSITNASTLADIGEASPSATTASVSGAQTVTVATNNGGGYYLTAKAISNDASGTVSNKLLPRANVGDIAATSSTGFNSLTAKTAKASIGAGYWGWSLDDSTYRPVATTVSGSGIIAYSTAPTAATTTTLYYGARSSSSLVQGNYSATVRYTALANDGTAKTIYGD